ncbi:MAG: hypothetical protein J0H53_19465 [Rhizobiales bacterium]|nr:hypothetical protein [Hyphomicrobiales bacterium]
MTDVRSTKGSKDDSDRASSGDEGRTKRRHEAGCELRGQGSRASGRQILAQFVAGGRRRLGKIERKDRNALIASACIMAVFATAPLYLSTVMIAIGSFSTGAAGGFPVLFVAAFFLLFWLRARYQKKRDSEK